MTSRKFAKGLSVYIRTKKKDGKSYQCWICEWRGYNGKIKRSYLGPVEGKRALSEEDAFAKALKMKFEDLGKAIMEDEYLGDMIKCQYGMVLVNQKLH